MKDTINKYLDYRKKIIAFRYVDWLINWDQKTQAPPKSDKFRSEQVEVLSKMYFDLRSNKEFLEIIEKLLDNIEVLSESDEDLAQDVKKIAKELEVIRKVPIKDYIDYQVTLAKSTQVWNEARSEEHTSELQSRPHLVCR